MAGLALEDRIAGAWRSAALIAVTTAVFGILLWLATGGGPTVSALSWGAALLVGLAQAIALVPGVSRSGITMTAALFLGLTRAGSARFSLLLSIPTTAAAGTLAVIGMLRTGDSAAAEQAVIAALLAFGCAFLAIAGLMRWLKRASFTPFVVYRLLLAGALAWFLATGWLQGLRLVMPAGAGPASGTASMGRPGARTRVRGARAARAKSAIRHPSSASPDNSCEGGGGSVTI